MVAHAEARGEVPEDVPNRGWAAREKLKEVDTAAQCCRLRLRLCLRPRLRSRLTRVRAAHPEAVRESCAVHADDDVGACEVRDLLSDRERRAAHYTDVYNAPSSPPRCVARARRVARRAQPLREACRVAQHADTRLAISRDEHNAHNLCESKRWEIIIYEGGQVKSLAGFAQNVTVNKSNAQVRKRAKL